MLNESLPRRGSVLLFCCSHYGCLRHTTTVFMKISQSDEAPPTAPFCIQIHVDTATANTITSSATRDARQDRGAKLTDETKRRELCVTCSWQGVDTMWNCRVSTSDSTSPATRGCCRHRRPNCWPSFCTQRVCKNLHTVQWTGAPHTHTHTTSRGKKKQTFLGN